MISWVYDDVIIDTSLVELSFTWLSFYAWFRFAQEVLISFNPTIEQKSNKNLKNTILCSSFTPHIDTMMGIQLLNV